MQLGHEVQKATDIQEDVKDLKKHVSYMNNVYTKGTDFYKYGNNPYDDRPDREANYYGGT